MFIELTEALRCPRPHDESYLVCVPVVMDGRRVVRGVLGCPECGGEYQIVDGVAHFGEREQGGTGAAAGPRGPSSELTAEAAAAFLDLQGPGGYVLLVGEAGRLGHELAARLDRVHVVAVNPPGEVRAAPGLSVLLSPGGFPVKRHSMRGVVVGADAAAGWGAAAVAALLPGLHAVIEDERGAPEGLAELARGAGVFVGEKRSR